MAPAVRRIFGGKTRDGQPKSTAGFSQGCYVSPDLMFIEYQTAAKVEKKKRDELGWIYFRSKREAKVWIRLKQDESAGRIRNLRRQVKWKLHVPAAPDPGSLIQPPAPIQITSYAADYVYDELVGDAQTGMWAERVADAKGFPTPEYELKKKWMAAEYGIHIVEL